MSEPREIEAKFEIGREDRERLASVDRIGRFAVFERQRAEQDDVYFDTEDDLLAAAGSTLRVRRTTNGARMTYKGQRELAQSADEAHIASRLEDEVTLDSTQASAVTVDGPLPEMANVSPLDRARTIVGGVQLRPIARLENARVMLMLRDDDGSTLELAVDNCVGTRLRDGRKIAFDEVELETKSAGRAALIDATNALQAMFPSLRPSQLTKLGRTMN